jgi:hypothetical protein
VLVRSNPPGIAENEGEGEKFMKLMKATLRRLWFLTRPTSIVVSLTVMVALVAGTVSLAAASSAAASKPVVEEEHSAATVPIWDCGDFQILDRFVLDGTLRYFYDKEGKLEKIIKVFSGTDTFINSETGKEIPTTTIHNSVMYDPETDLYAVNGVTFRVTVPGSGAVFLNVGRFVANEDLTNVTFEAGPLQFFDGDVEGLCNALDEEEASM